MLVTTLTILFCCLLATLFIGGILNMAHDADETINDLRLGKEDEHESTETSESSTTGR